MVPGTFSGSIFDSSFFWKQNKVGRLCWASFPMLRWLYHIILAVLSGSTTPPLHHLDPGPAWPPSQQTYPAHRPLPRQVRAPPSQALLFFVLSAHAEMRGNPDVGEGDLSTLFVAFFTCTPVTCDCRRLSNQSRCTSTRLLSTHDRILGLFWPR